MKKNFLTKILLIFLFFPNISLSNDLLLGKEVAESICAACHGIDGRAASGGNSALVPNIFAQNKDYLVVKLKDYKSGKINHPQMTLIAQMLTEDQILNVSEWYSKILVELKLPE
jgi:cytochrome c553|tara:strand:- start:451 stop:792 length:342 start_codon:yes stop_codon:yes gene_type:complete